MAYKPMYPDRGKSIIAFPPSYCVLDLETTGLSSEWDEIIEIGAIKFDNGQEIDRFQTLVQPTPYEDGTFLMSFITELTGITDDMLKDAPKIDSVLPSILNFLGDLPIIGYNASFDVNFLYANCNRLLKRPFTTNFIDAMRLARKLHPELSHHRLIDMSALFHISQDGAHRAIADCLTTHECYLRLKEEALSRYGTEENFVLQFKRKHGQAFKAADILCDASQINEDSPIYEKHCVFTGKLDRYTRKEAMQIVANLGGINEDGVTKKTNFLILGNNDYCTTIKDGKSSKQKKAEKYKLAGQDIEIVPEDTFYSMLEDS